MNTCTHCGMSVNRGRSGSQNGDSTRCLICQTEDDMRDYAQPTKKRSTMDANEYQAQACRTLIAEPDRAYTGHELMLVWTAMGLAGESGEVADTIKKAVFHQHGIDRAELIKELGDVCWYVAGLCSILDVDLSTVMERNIAKLRVRYPDGYSSADSAARLDTKEK